jgi:hypothetical protein
MASMSLGSLACSSTTTGGDDGSKSRIALDADSFCDQLIACSATEQTFEQCTQTYEALRASPACAEAVKVATCEDLQSSTSETINLCFPQCGSPGSAVCNGDGTITQCGSGGRSVTVDCASGCTAGGFARWTGECGTTYRGQTSDSAKCWCE